MIVSASRLGGLEVEVGSMEVEVVEGDVWITLCREGLLIDLRGRV